MRRLAAAAVFLAAHVAGADNLLQNPSFATSLAGWTPAAGASAVWVPGDATGSPVSGAADVTSTAAAPGAVTGLTQCFGVLPGVAYDFGSRILIQAPSGVSGFATLSFFSGAGCGGTELARTSTDTPPPGAWALMGGKGAVAPDGAASGRILLAVQKAAAGGFADALFDDAYVNAPLATLVIPAAASIHGQNAAFFHTDIWLLNRSYTASLIVSAQFRCYRSMTCPSVPTSVTLAPRQSLEIPDAVGGFFGAPETAGAIELSYDANVGDLSATSRTYTPSLPSPTFGTAIPALDTAQARSLAVFLGLGNNGGSLASGFRTNAGVYNPTDGPVSATLTLFGPDGTALGTPVVLSLGAREAQQVNDVFSAAGAGALVTTNVVLVVASTVPVFPYVTVIDNQSGDSVFVPTSDDTAAP